MTFQPAHKDTDNPPGQIVNRPEQTLGDYIARKNWHEDFDQVAEEKGLKRKKLTFEEWYNLHWKECPVGTFNYVDTFKFIWQSAQENV